MSSGMRRSIIYASRGLLAFVLLLFLFRYVDVREVLSAFGRANVMYLTIAVLLVAANIGVQILKWRYFVRQVNPESTNLESIASYLFGLSLGTITPGQIGEFGGRILRHSSLKPGAIVGLTLLDKVQMICILGIGGITSLSFLYRMSVATSLLLLLPSCAILLALFFRPRTLTSWTGNLKWKILKHPFVNDFNDAVGLFHKDQLIVSFALSLLFYFIICLQMYCLLNAFADVSVPQAFLGFASMMFLKAVVPISLGDLGIREASSVYFYSLVGVSAPVSLGAALLLFVLNVLVPSLAGLIFIPRSPIK